MEKISDQFPYVEISIVLPTILIIVVFVPGMLVGFRHEPANWAVLASSGCRCESLEEENTHLKKELAEKTSALQEARDEIAFLRKTIQESLESFFFGSKLKRCVVLSHDLHLGDDKALVRIDGDEVKVDVLRPLSRKRKAGEFVTIIRHAQVRAGFSVSDESCSPQ